ATLCVANPSDVRWYSIMNRLCGILAVGLVVMTFSCGKPSEYPEGKDTLASFAGGRIQLLRVLSGKMLYDLNKKEPICLDVVNCRERGDKLEVKTTKGDVIVVDLSN